MTRILSRRRRISVKIVSDKNVSKYQSAGRSCQKQLTPSGSLRSPPPLRQGGGKGRYGIGFCVSSGA